MQGRGVPETIRRTVPENAAPVGRVRASASLMRRVPTAELPREGLVLPEGFRTWSKLPADMPVRREPYDLTTILPRAANACIFHAVESPDAFLHEEPSYVTWTPQIHRAPV